MIALAALIRFLTGLLVCQSAPPAPIPTPTPRCACGFPAAHHDRENGWCRCNRCSYYEPMPTRPWIEETV